MIHGTEDAIRTYGSGAALAELLGGTVGHARGLGAQPQSRDPVKVNLILRDFIKPQTDFGLDTGHGAAHAALYISSPIGLGHAQRDVAIAARAA